MRIIKYEIKRAFSSFGFKISILIGILIGILDLSLFHDIYKSSESAILIQAWIGTDFVFAYNNLFYVLLPILACLPYAGTYFSDIHNGYDKNICIRTSRISYWFAKCIAVFLSAFSAIVIPLLINLLLCAGFYPNYRPEKLFFITTGIQDVNMFANIFHKNPLLYMIIFTIIDGLFGGLMGLMSVCFSRWASNQFSTLMFPFVIYIYTGVVLAFKDGYNYGIREMVNPLQTYITRVEYMFFSYLFLFIICVSISWLWTRKRDIL